VKNYQKENLQRQSILTENTFRKQRQGKDTMESDNDIS
jgi:hypothetical protein